MTATYLTLADLTKVNDRNLQIATSATSLTMPQC